MLRTLLTARILRAYMLELLSSGAIRTVAAVLGLVVLGLLLMLVGAAEEVRVGTQ